MIGKALLTTVALIAFLFQQACFAQDNRCNAILAHGPFDIYSENSAYVNYSYVHNLYCSDTANTADKAQSLNASVPLDGLMVGLGITNKDYQTFRQQLCSDNQTLLYNSGWKNTYAQTASQAILSAYDTCIHDTSSGLKQYLTDFGHADSRTFVWNIKYTTPGEQGTIPVTRYEVQNATCVGPPGKDISPGKYFDVGGSAVPLRCTRTDCSEAILTVWSKESDANPGSIYVPTIPVPPVPPEPQWYSAGQWGWAMNNALGRSVDGIRDPQDVCESSAVWGHWIHVGGAAQDCSNEPGADAVVVNNGLATYRPEKHIPSGFGNCNFAFRCRPRTSAAPKRPSWCGPNG